MNVGTLILLVAVLLVIFGGVLLIGSARHQQDERVTMRLRAVTQNDLAVLSSPRSGFETHLTRILKQSGLSLSRTGMLAILAAYLLGAVLVYFLSVWTWIASLVWLLVVPILAFLFLDLRYRRRKELLLRQLPAFLDHVIRGMATGSNLHSSFVAATEDAPEPLREVMSTVSRAVELGDGLENSIHRASETFRLRELQLLAVGVGINTRYGGSAKILLENISEMIRRQERWRREIRALTGETRVTAVVMAIVPLALAGYIAWTNPDYMQAFWEHSGGRIALFVALFLQFAGVFTLWRMLRSI